MNIKSPRICAFYICSPLLPESLRSIPGMAERRVQNWVQGRCGLSGEKQNRRRSEINFSLGVFPPHPIQKFFGFRMVFSFGGKTRGCPKKKGQI